PLLAGFDADELILEARDEAAAAQFERVILVAAAGEFDAADRADAVHDQDIALLGRAVDGLGFALLLGDALESAIDLFLGHIGLQPLDLDLAEIGELDLRLQRRAQIALAHRLGRAVGDRTFQHLAHDRRAVALAQHGEWNFAGTEARQADGTGDFAEAIGHAALDIGGRDDDGHLVLQAV